MFVIFSATSPDFLAYSPLIHLRRIRKRFALVTNGVQGSEWPVQLKSTTYVHLNLLWFTITEIFWAGAWWSSEEMW